MEVWDLAIKNAIVVDPENKSITSGNIGIYKNKIATITDKRIYGKKEIDAHNNIVCPGFIDIHGHVDGHLECGELSVVQGVTTTIGGNCGFGPTELKSFFDEQDKKGFIINQAEFIGHSFSLRERAGVTNPYIPASAEQIEKMVQLVIRAFNEGAIGLSFGLEYAPGSSFEEVIKLSNIAVKHNKLVSIHTRLQYPNDLDSLREAIRISEFTGAAVQVSHFVYQYGTGLMSEALEIIDDARRRGLKVWVDSGMYTSFATNIGTSVFDEDHIEKFGWKFSDMLVATGKYKGERLTPNLYRELRGKYAGETVICFTGVENEIYEALSKDYVMLSSDIGPTPSGDTSEGHPQNTGTFPRFFRRMVREQKSMPILTAVEKCTLLPAKVLGLKNKGRVSVDADADLVILDIENITDKADFLGIGRPDARPEGVNYVIVNGRIVVEKGGLVSGIFPGRTLRAIC